MAEYIKREAAIKAMEKADYTAIADDADSCKADYLREIIESVPAADVAPVRHGRWEVVVGSDGKEHMVCTVCRKQQGLTGVFSYCPNCGAKMDEED